MPNAPRMATASFYTTEAEEKFSESASTFLKQQISVKTYHTRIIFKKINNHFSLFFVIFVDKQPLIQKIMKEEDYSKAIEVFSGSPWEAEIIKGLLESNNIRCVIKGWNYGDISTLYCSLPYPFSSQRKNTKQPPN